MLTWLKRLTPSWALQAYHWCLAWLAALVYGFPSAKLIVIGVTGTKGKSTTVHLIAQLLERAGFRVGATSTVGFKVAEREWPNNRKVTMLGRFALQRLLRQMVRAGCRYAVIETSSQGIAQYRHIAINYDAAVFTNLTPEHLEAHGGFQNYQQAKEGLFSHLTERRHKTVEGKTVEKVIAVNGADERANAFLRYPADRKYIYSLYGHVGPQQLVARNLKLETRNTTFEISNVEFNLPLPGKFNVLNALASVCIGLSQGLTLEQCRDALRQARPVPGRLEFIEAGQPFTVIVDYAHEPASVKALYEFVGELKIKNAPLRSASDGASTFAEATVDRSEGEKKLKIEGKESQSPQLSSGNGMRSPTAPLQKGDLACRPKLPEERRTGGFASGQASRIIHLLGSTGGGRDTGRRAVLGALAAEHADVVIATNEDPYDDDPNLIIREVANGARSYLNEHPERTGVEVLEIADRREAIRRALQLAQPGDIVLLTGKGSEPVMAVGGGKLVPWDDRKVVREELGNLKLET